MGSKASFGIAASLDKTEEAFIVHGEEGIGTDDMVGTVDEVTVCDEFRG